MFNPVFVTLYFSVIYLAFHVFPPAPTHVSCHQMCVCTHSHCLTASSQFASLNTIPFSFFITRPRSRMSHTRNILVSILILLSGDIQSNPGPTSNVSSLNMCILNIRSLTNPLHYTAVSDLAQTHNIHIFSLTETWISPNTTSAQLFDAIPHGFSFISTPRPVSGSSSCSIVRGWRHRISCS